MDKEKLAVVLSVVCAVSSVVGTLLTASIALGANRRIGRFLEKKFPKWHVADYGGDSAPK